MSAATTIYISMDTAAVSLGADEVVEAIQSNAKEAGVEVKIVRTGSRGMVWLEPLVEVEIDGVRHAYGPVTPNDVASLFKGGFVNGGKHPLAMGPTEEIDYLKRQTRLAFAQCGLDNPLDLEAFEVRGGFAGLKKALAMSTEEIIDEVAASGLRGRGGAGFPTGIKWRTVAAEPASQKYIACNADEGDSGTFSDRMMMEGDPFTLLEGMIIAGLAVGATKGVIYLRSEYPIARDILRRAIETLRDQGWLGEKPKNLGNPFDVELFIGAGAYICGEETSMLESLEGKRGQIRAKPPLPAIKGLFGMPTVVNNVISLASVPRILADGGKKYAGFGVERSRGTLPFQLAGNIKRGGLVEVPFGITIREIIEEFGGGTLSGRKVRAVQVGGPLGAYFPDSMLDTPLDYEVMAAHDALVGHGGIVVFDDSVDMAQQAKFAMEFCAIESCGKCTPCRIGSIRGAEVIDKIIAGNDLDVNFEVLDDLLDLMETASLCALGGLTPLPVKSALKYFPEDFGVRAQTVKT
ncbi:MAG: NADH-ubiquinone oxidoreductase-F iron-sulfur binding region domain-containing protein [Sphingomonadales bacterium]